jgi:hypothetical protein
MLMCHATDIRNVANDWDLMEAKLVLSRIVVDKGDRVQAELLIGQELLGDHVAGGAGTDDDGAHVVIATTAAGVPGTNAEEQAGGDDECAGEKNVQGNN